MLIKFLCNSFIIVVIIIFAMIMIVIMIMIIIIIHIIEWRQFLSILKIVRQLNHTDLD